MFPVRLSILTYNLWNNQRWPQREKAIRDFFQRFRPDVFCLQEVCGETIGTIRQALPDYLHVEDEFPGWNSESNIFWNANLLNKVEYGQEDIKIRSDRDRRMFWVRLLLPDTNQTIFVSTAHFTFQEHPDELNSGQSPRLQQVNEAIQVLNRLVKQGEPAFFMGDLNDPVLPTYKLAEAGYHSCFVKLGLVPPPTWPSFPTANVVNWNRLNNQTIDWLVSNQYAHPIIAVSPQFYSGDFSPSDHWPVLAYYEIG